MTEINSDLVIQRTDLAGSQIDNEMVFFNQNTGKYFATGPVGAEIWEYLTMPRSIGQICDHLLTKFEVDRATCETEVRSFVGDLIEGGIVTTAS
jgi:hypothetical protein